MKKKEQNKMMTAHEPTKIQDDIVKTIKPAIYAGSIIKLLFAGNLLFHQLFNISGITGMYGYHVYASRVIT